MFRTEEAVDILCFGQKKPSTFYVSDRRSRRNFIFRTEEAVEKFMFQKVKPVEFLFLGQKKPQKSCFSAISQDWIAKWSKDLVIPVVFPWIRWAITERFQFNLVIHFNMPLPWTEHLIRGSKTYGDHFGYAQQKSQQKYSSNFRDHFVNYVPSVSVPVAYSTCFLEGYVLDSHNLWII